MFSELPPDKGVDADEDEVDDEQKGGPIEHWTNPSLQVLSSEEGGFAEKETTQHALVVCREPWRDILPEQVSPVIFHRIEPERVGKGADQFVHGGMPRHGCNRHSHHIDDQ